jgi:hypothetical protein
MYLRFNVDQLSADEITAGQYLAFKEQLVEGEMITCLLQRRCNLQHDCAAVAVWLQHYKMPYHAMYFIAGSQALHTTLQPLYRLPVCRLHPSFACAVCPQVVLLLPPPVLHLGYASSVEHNPYKVLEIDLGPFNRNFPRMNMAASIGQGVTFLNRHLSSSMFQVGGMT